MEERFEQKERTVLSADPGASTEAPPMVFDPVERSYATVALQRRAAVGPQLFALGDLIALTLVTALFQPLRGWHMFLLIAGLVGMLGLMTSRMPELRPGVLDVAPLTFAAVAGAGLLAAGLFPEADGTSAMWWALYAFVSVLLARGLMLLAAKLAGNVFAYRGRPTLVIGAGPVGVGLTRALLDHPEFGLDPVGFLDDAEENTEHLPLPLIGTPRELEPLARRFGVKAVVIAFGVTREPELVRTLRQVSGTGIELYVVPRLFDLNARYASEVRGYPLVRIGGSVAGRGSRLAKRAIDVVGSLALLVLFSPLIGAIAVAVKRSSPGPLLFRQKRVGEGGRHFEVLKFRSMRENDDSDTTWSVADDDRVTPVGRVLRASHLDELPQLWNVLRGDMSLVGPRPERPTFTDLFGSTISGYDDRHRVPVGITGWAQVNGLWGDTSIEDRARLDNRYIEEWSLWKDVVILLRTLPTLFGR